MSDESDHETGARLLGKGLPLGPTVVAVLAFVLGVVATLIHQTWVGETSYHLSTPEIVNFFFTVALGASAIVLALVSIVLSNTAQETLIRRNDEGIRIQNETHRQTVEVLSDIETSTGVTEKRVEDLRTLLARGDLVVREAVEEGLRGREGGVREDDIDEISERVSELLKDEITGLARTPDREVKERLEEMRQRREKAQKISERWEEEVNKVGSELEERDVELEQVIAGKLSAESPDEFWDIVGTRNGIRFVVDVHTVEQVDDDRHTAFQWRESSGSRENYAKNIAWRVEQDGIDVLFITFDEDHWDERGYREVRKLLDKALDGRGARLVTLGGDPADLAEQIRETLDELAE